MGGTSRLSGSAAFFVYSLIPMQRKSFYDFLEKTDKIGEKRIGKTDKIGEKCIGKTDKCMCLQCVNVRVNYAEK